MFEKLFRLSAIGKSCVKRKKAIYTKTSLAGEEAIKLIHSFVLKLLSGKTNGVNLRG